MPTPSDTPSTVTRRRHSAAFKRKLIALANRPGASVAAIALEHGVNANLLFKWRNQLRDARMPTTSVAKPPAPPATPSRAPVLLPVTIDPLPPVGTTANGGRAVGVMEIEYGGARVRLRGAVDDASVRCVLLTLRELA